MAAFDPNTQMPPPNSGMAVANYTQFPFEQRQAAIEQRRRMLVELMRRQSQAANAPTPQGQMVGRVYFNPSLAETLPGVIDQLAAYQGYNAENQALQKDVGEYEAADRAAAAAHVASRPKPTPAVEGNNPSAYQPAQAPTTADQIAWAQQGATIPSRRDVVAKILQDLEVNEPVRQEQRLQRTQDREDRQAEARATLDANLALRRDQLAQQAEAARLRSEDTRLGIEQRREAAQQHAALMAQLAADRKAVSDKAATEGKPLSMTDLAKVQDTLATAQQAAHFRDTFKDEYAGLGSDIRRAAGSILPASMTTDSMKATSDWWREYQARKNVVRNKLFGAALTAQEKSEWEKADVRPDMDPARIRENLTRRAQLEEQAAGKLEGALRAPTRAGQLDALKGASPAAPVRVTTPAEAAKLQPGTRFVTPDGQVRVRQ
ncbi:MAG: hypothetical protein JNL87_23010 [Burkholderiaceae bacterium]|nr:hypothetical protein [Burkholderiaceae bacterium]